MLKRDNAPEACFYLQDERKICKLADSSDVIPAATRKEPQCLYRVLNILFYDRFDEGFAQLGNVADLAALDASIQQSIFWEGVQEAFEGQEDYTTTCTLQMMRFSVNCITLNLESSSS